MNQYLSKSQEFKKSIEILKKDKAKTNHVKVQNAYYTCFLYIKHIMSVYLVSDDIYYNFSKKINKSRNIHGGSHELLLFICRILLGFHKVKKNRYMNIDAKIKSLKSDRAIATYTKDEITDDELQDILDAANNTIARVEELEQDLQSKQAKNRLHKIEDYNYITKFEWSVENNKGKTDYIYL